MSTGPHPFSCIRPSLSETGDTSLRPRRKHLFFFFWPMNNYFHIPECLFSVSLSLSASLPLSLPLPPSLCLFPFLQSLSVWCPTWHLSSLGPDCIAVGSLVKKHSAQARGTMTIVMNRQKGIQTLDLLAACVSGAQAGNTAVLILPGLQAAGLWELEAFSAGCLEVNSRGSVCPAAVPW